jgi:hypothetical protein
VLLAGRFLVPRTSLLALPEGPVAALDLSSGDSVSLAYGPAAVDADELARRIERWNAVAFAGCPVVRELRWHLGRPLVRSELASRAVPDPPERAVLVARAAALGSALDAAGLGLPPGPADLALGAEGIYLRRPALWPPDPGLPLERALGDAAARLLDLRPAALAEHAPARKPRPPIALRALATPRTRIALVLGAAVVTAVIASSLAGSSRGDVAAHAAAVRQPVPVHHVASKPVARERPRVRAPLARATSRGGPARVLLALPRVVPPAPVYAPRRRLRVAPAPPPGWVAGLFVGPSASS